MYIRLDNFTHFPIKDGINEITNLTAKWLNWSVTLVRSSLQNPAVAYLTLIAINGMAMFSSEWMMTKICGDDRDLDDNEMIGAVLGWGCLYTIQVIAVAKFLQLPISRLFAVSVSLATLGVIVFRPDQWLYNKFTKK